MVSLHLCSHTCPFEKPRGHPPSAISFPHPDGMRVDYPDRLKANRLKRYSSSDLNSSEYRSPAKPRERLAAPDLNGNFRGRSLIRRMAHDNPTLSQDCIANALSRKLGLCVPPCAVRQYLVGSKYPQSSLGQRLAMSRQPCFDLSSVAASRILGHDRTRHRRRG
jgi:hypothetical protein